MNSSLEANINYINDIVTKFMRKMDEAMNIIGDDKYEEIWNSYHFFVIKPYENKIKKYKDFNKTTKKKKKKFSNDFLRMVLFLTNMFHVLLNATLSDYDIVLPYMDDNDTILFGVNPLKKIAH